MTNYDISHLPPPVQGALLQLTAALVQAWAAPEAWRTLPPDLRCAYGTVSLAPAAAAALPAPPGDPRPTGEATALPPAADRGLPPADVRPLLAHQRGFADLAPTVPRSARTRAVLAALATLAPQAVSAAELVPRLWLPREAVRESLRQLLRRQLIDQPSHGLYRYRPPAHLPTNDQVSTHDALATGDAPGSRSAVDPAFVQTVDDILRADLTLDQVRAQLQGLYRRCTRTAPEAAPPP